MINFFIISFNYQYQYFKNSYSLSLFKYPQLVSNAGTLELPHIEDAIRKLGKGKSPGPDGVRAENITLGQAPLFLALWDRIRSEGKMPRFMNDSLTCPIHKKGDPPNPDNFRPISLINIVVKILELAVLSKYKSLFLEKIPQEQFGFKPKLSSLDQVDILLSFLDQRKGSDKQSFILFYDIQKALTLHIVMISLVLLND